MRRIDRQHIEKRVSCKDCPNKYCLDCNTAGCPVCHSVDFYTTHGHNIKYNETDLDTIHGTDSSDNIYRDAAVPQMIPIQARGLTTGRALNISQRNNDAVDVRTYNTLLPGSGLVGSTGEAAEVPDVPRIANTIDRTLQDMYVPYNNPLQTNEWRGSPNQSDIRRAQEVARNDIRTDHTVMSARQQRNIDRLRERESSSMTMGDGRSLFNPDTGI